MKPYNRKIKKKLIVFRPWNVLIVLAAFGCIVFIMKHNITLPDAPRQAYHLGGFIVALIGTGYFLLKIIHFLKTSGWATAHATIIESKIVEVDDSEGVQYKPHISYTYHVGTTEYTSSKINPSGSWSSSFPSIASKPVNRFPAGKTVQAYYNPSRPEESFLERRGMFFLLAGMCTFAIMLLVFSLTLAGIIQV